jgi:hypothetical protein
VPAALRHPSFALAATAIALVTAVFVAWAATGLGSETALLWASDLATVLAAGAATALCLRARAAHDGALRRFWALMAAATACWTAAEAVWGVYDLVLRTEVPLPSWADVGYLAAMPLTVAALLSHPATRGSGVRAARRVLEGSLVATALLFLSWTLVLGPL